LENPVDRPAPKKEQARPSPKRNQPTLREIEEDPNLPPIKPVERTLEKPPEPPPPRPAPKPRPSPRPLDDEAPNLPPARSATPTTPPRPTTVRPATRQAEPGPAQTSSDIPKSPARPSPSTASSSGADAGSGAYESAKANAAYLHNPKPEYPAIAKRRQWQGKVILKVRVLADGKASQVSIATSSGHDVLDEAAVEAVSQWHFVPAKRGGQAVESWVNVPINFNLLDAQ
jgi:protein TonB